MPFRRSSIHALPEPDSSSRARLADKEALCQWVAWLHQKCVAPGEMRGAFHLGNHCRHSVIHQILQDPATEHLAGNTFDRDPLARCNLLPRMQKCESGRNPGSRWAPIDRSVGEHANMPTVMARIRGGTG